MKTLPTEAQEQEKLIQWLNLKKIFHFAPMNENQGSFTNRKVAMIQANKAKKMGKVKGVSDLVVLLPHKILFIELKRSKKLLKSGKISISHTKVSKEQEVFIENTNRFGYADGVICYGAGEAIKAIQERL